VTGLGDGTLCCRRRSPEFSGVRLTAVACRRGEGARNSELSGTQADPLQFIHSARPVAAKRCPFGAYLNHRSVERGQLASELPTRRSKGGPRKKAPQRAGPQQRRAARHIKPPHSPVLLQLSKPCGRCIEVVLRVNRIVTTCCPPAQTDHFSPPRELCNHTNPPPQSAPSSHPHSARHQPLLTLLIESLWLTKSTSLDTLSFSEILSPLSNPRTAYLKCLPMFSIWAR
jgi:hypothetical protein